MVHIKFLRSNSKSAKQHHQSEFYKWIYDSKSVKSNDQRENSYNTTQQSMTQTYTKLHQYSLFGIT